MFKYVKINCIIAIMHYVSKNPPSFLHFANISTHKMFFAEGLDAIWEQ